LKGEKEMSVKHGAFSILIFVLIVVAALSQSDAPTKASNIASPISDWVQEPLGQDASLVVVSSNDAWLLGGTDATPARTQARHWNGREWRVVLTPNVGGGNNWMVCYNMENVSLLSSGDIWTQGCYEREGGYGVMIGHWDGTQWSVRPVEEIVDDTGTSLALTGFSASGANDIWVTGYESSGRYPDDRRQPFAWHWDGSSWGQTEVPIPTFAPPNPNDAIRSINNQLGSIRTIGPNDAWAVGTYGPSTNLRPLVLHWDGHEWTPVGTPGPPSEPYHMALWSLEIISPSDIWATGSKRSSGSAPDHGQTKTLIEHWNGTQWSIVDSPNKAQPPPSGNGGDSIGSIVALGPNDVWASGFYDEAAGTFKGPDKPLLLHWDGRSWSHQPTPLDGIENARMEQLAAGADKVLWATGVTNTNRQPQDWNNILFRPGSKEPSPTPTSASTPTTIPTISIPGENNQTFPETGKTVSGLFLDYWEKNGGLAQQGFPISAVIGEISDLNGKPYTVQYFERAVFEYHPENQPPYNVLLSQLGTFQYRKKYPNGGPGQQANNSADAMLFPETGKRVGGKFLEYWKSHGGLAQQGYPISEEFVEKSDLNGKEYLVQYFERAVFEYHPENQPPYDVLLSQLGTFQYKAKYPGRQ
jgi:hypothetical protein